MEITDHTYKTFTPCKLWLDTDGIPIQAHGGGVLWHEGIYYWYGENKAGRTHVVPAKSGEGEIKRIEAIGMSCYSSADLVNWKNEGVVLPAVTDDPAHELHTSKVLERPKVLRHPDGHFVMWFHVDDDTYHFARVGVAVTNSPTGRFVYHGSFSPNGQDSRDLTVFQDSSGVAWLFSSSEWNVTMHISRLADDWLDVENSYECAFVNGSREAPAVFEHDGIFYLISSGCTGWDPNAAELAVAAHPQGPWRLLGNPCRGEDAEITWRAQSTFVLPVHGKPGAFIAMFDRWNKDDLGDSRYVWLPVEWQNGEPIIRWHEEWSLDFFK